MTLLAKIFYCNNKENELKNYHNKTNQVNFVWMQDFWMLLKSDSISWRKTLKNSHNSQMQWPVVSTHCQETKKHRNQKVGSEETPTLDPYWKLQHVSCTVSTDLRSELCLWTKTILTAGSESLMDRIGLWWIWTTMKKKFQKFSSKSMRWNWMRVILHADQRPKQNHKNVLLPAPPQKLEYCILWLCGVEEINSSSSTCKII